MEWFLCRFLCTLGFPWAPVRIVDYIRIFSRLHKVFMYTVQSKLIDWYIYIRTTDNPWNHRWLTYTSYNVLKPAAAGLETRTLLRSISPRPCYCQSLKPSVINLLYTVLKPALFGLKPALFWAPSHQLSIIFNSLNLKIHGAATCHPARLRM